MLFLLGLSALLGACGRADSSSDGAILHFEASPRTLESGETLRFSWRTQGAASCRLELTRRVPEAAAAGNERVYELRNCAAGELEHRATEPGLLHAALHTVGGNGQRHTRALQGLEVVAPGAPRAAFAVLPGDDPLAFTFDADASAGHTFRWSFGDGNRAEGRRVDHRYAAPGRYTVTLTVEGASGATDTASETVSPKRERLILFDAEDPESGLSAWRRVRGGEANWPIVEGAFEVKPGGGVGVNNLRTEEVFGDFRLHLEFWVPRTPPGTPAQARGNSGVYLQGRYEVQILDSFGVTLGGADDAGAIYGVKDADHNASRPPETWQSFEITFRAARFGGTEKLENARVSVLWNGVLVHDEVEIPRSTLLGDREGPSDGPIVLQDHGSRVRFRNVWLEPL